MIRLHALPPLRRSASLAAVVLVLALTGCADPGGGSRPPVGSAVPAPAVVGAGDVVALAEAFAAGLSDEQRAELVQDRTFANASNWSNFPDPLLARGFGSGTGRVGLRTATLSGEQWAALEALLAAATGSAEDEGFDEVVQQLVADDHLADLGDDTTYGSGEYVVAFLGTPSASGTWQLQFGGHHLAVATTYVDGALAGATPSFRGAEPSGPVEVGGEIIAPQHQEQQAFAALLASLDPAQVAAAELPAARDDLLLGPGADWSFPATPEGLPGAQLTPDQRALLLAVITTFVGDVDDANAAAILARYDGELADTRIAFSGTTGLAELGDYVRIDGPSVWIELSMQPGIVFDGPHPHAVWRDERTDYGGLTP